MSQRILKLCVASLLNILCFPGSGQKVWTNDAQSDEEVREDTAVEEGGDRIFVFFAIFRGKGIRGFAGRPKKKPFSIASFRCCCIGQRRYTNMCKMKEFSVDKILLSCAQLILHNSFY